MQQNCRCRFTVKPSDSLVSPSRTNAKHISNQKVDSTCKGSEWSTPANTYISRISRCARQYNFYYPSPDVDELFLLGDSGQADPNRVMIFVRDNHRNWVQGMDRVFIDGAFTLAPPLFSRCLWFLLSVHNTCFPRCTLCYPTNAKKHTMDYSDVSKRYGHLSIQHRSVSTLRWRW